MIWNKQSIAANSVFYTIISEPLIVTKIQVKLIELPTDYFIYV